MLSRRIGRAVVVSVNRRFFSSLPSHTIVAMPALSPTMAVGTIGAWNKKVGDKVDPGDSIAEVQTDKASMAFEAQDEFFIAKLLIDAGAEVPVGAPILISVDDASHVAAFADYKLEATAPAAAPAAAAPAPVPVAAPVSAPAPAPVPTPAPAPKVEAPKPVSAPAPAPAVAAAVATPSNSNVAYSVRWGSGVNKSAIIGKLSADQVAYIAKFGRSQQKPVKA